jgi:hypothetical protein
MNRREPPKPDRTVWTYWVSRDSLQGELSGQCHLWWQKPLRVKHGYRVTWVNTDEHNPGLLGAFSPRDIKGWFRTIPETDLELIRIEMHPTEAELAEYNKR